MVGRAKSQLLKTQIERKAKDDLMAFAVKLYIDEQQRAVAPGEKKKSSRTICQTVSDQHFASTGKRIFLDHNTLVRHAKGGMTLTESNGRKSWLISAEQDIIVDFAIDMARRGFPLSPRRLKDHAEAILQHRLGQDYPKKGLGRDWGNRFITKHHSRLGMYWSSALDGSRGRAVNPVTKEEYFTILKKVREEYNIPDELVYGADETGIQSGIGTTERVIGPVGAKIQHQQRSGGRENITVLPTICADGTSLPPTVIFKGEHFQTKWLQENPLDARMGYQKKGYTSGEIGVAWLRDWDKQTHAKALRRTRLMIVDGHSSHYTLGFLEYARDNNIVILCYPSHSTHVYQGLDVVIFSSLKRAWSDERDRFEAHGTTVSKLNFMAIYARAHMRAFTKENIRMAFAKTGIVPYNPDVVTAEMMAPSLETSSTSLLPLGLASPTREIVDLISHHTARKRKRQEEARNTPCTPEPTSQSPTYTPIRRAINSLASTSASFLVSGSPIRSSFALPPLLTAVVPPPQMYNQTLLDSEPMTEREAKLQEALRKSEQIIQRQNEVMVGMQAQTVLQSMYLEGVRGQLQGQEAKKTANKKKAGKINMDGRAKILTQDAIIEGVKEWQTAQDEAAMAASAKKEAKVKYLAAMNIWKVHNSDLRERNSVLKAAHVAEVKKWEIERDSAKGDKRKPRWTKPKAPRYEKIIPKPKLADFVADESGSDSDEDEIDEDEDEDD